MKKTGNIENKTRQTVDGQKYTWYDSKGDFCTQIPEHIFQSC